MTHNVQVITTSESVLSTVIFWFNKVLSILSSFKIIPVIVSLIVENLNTFSTMAVICLL